MVLHGNIYNFLFIDHYLDYNYVLQPQYFNFFDTSCPITENEFGHTDQLARKKIANLT